MRYKKCCGQVELITPSTYQPLLQKYMVIALNERARPTQPTSAQIDQLITLYKANRYLEMENQARTISHLYPNSGLAFKTLGIALHLQGKDSLSAWQMAAELMPDDIETHFNLGVAMKDFGRLDEAVASYRKVLEINPAHAKANTNLGSILRFLGKFEDATVCFRRAIEPDSASSHFDLGIVLMESEKIDEAVVSFRRALEIDPGYAEALTNLGIAMKKLGQLNDAVASYRQALKVKPDLAEAHFNLGIALHDLGRIDEVVSSYRRVLEIKPDFVEAHINLGAALQDLGQLDDAVASYRRALEINPDYIDAHSNLGVALQKLGQLDDAESSYRRALEIKPNSSSTLNNLAWLLNVQGKPIMALNTIKQSLQIKETGIAKSIFIACVKRLHFAHDDNEIRVALFRALTEPWGRTSELARIGIDFVKLNSDIMGCVARANNAWPLRLSGQDLFGSTGLATLAADLLLCALSDSAPICDIEMERFLTMARHAMLETASRIMASDGEVDPALSFYCALTHQCFINEYVFVYTDEEIRKANDLRNSLAVALEANTPMPALWLVAVAAYFPLCSISLTNRLLERQWPEPVTAVLVQQVCEPTEELQLHATIPRLTSIEDEVSLLVQSQYEENPYPRWIKTTPAGEAKNIVEYLCQKFPLASFSRDSKSGHIDILVAGCGTGQHSINTAQQFDRGQVLAVDLSISSLSYAKRKTRELGITSIEYAQADLLKLGLLGRKFDIIESCGVLHHLADPWAGWRVLLSLLRSGGFMKLGFYSEVARKNIVRIRTFIAEQNYGTSVNEIRQCRQDLVDLDKRADFGTLLKLNDFFSISECRDLLFHVQEHRMTLTKINEFLQKNNLVFIGFEIDAHVLHAYKLRFHDDRAATNLEQWQIFENENPDTFIGMYQFWIQKVN